MRGEHYAVAHNATLTGVLLQVGDRHGDQARIQLTPNQAGHIASLLLVAMMEVEQNEDDLAASSSFQPPSGLDFSI
jgi:hypothetical protein